MASADFEIAKRWPLLLASFAGVFCSSVVLPYYTIGAFVGPVTSEFGWSRSEFQLAVLFSAGIGALLSPVVGWLIDRYGARRVAIPGLIGISAGFFMASVMNGQLWMFYASYSAMAILGAGTIPVSWTRAISVNFTKKRGLALGIVLSATGVCAMVAPHYTVWLESNYGWRAAYFGIGLLPLLVAAPLALFLFRPDGAVARNAAIIEEPRNLAGMTLGEASKGYRFWLLLLSVFLAYMAVSGIAPNLIPALTDDGLTKEQAASVQSILGVSIIGGRLLVGYLIDRFWAPGVAAIALCIPVIGACLLIGESGFAIACIAVLLIGIGAGAELDLMAFLAAKYFGLRHYAKIYAILYSALAVCSGAAPVLFARVFDQTKSYDLGFMVAAGLFALSAVAMLGLGRYPENRTPLSPGEPSRTT